MCTRAGVAARFALNFCWGVPEYAHLLRGRSIFWQVILPELWDAAVDLFDASRAGVVSDRKRTQKVQEKVNIININTKILKRACCLARRTLSHTGGA